MRITMQKAESLTREQMREFLAASEELDFALARRTEIYDLVERTLRRQRYLHILIRLAICAGTTAIRAAHAIPGFTAKTKGPLMGAVGLFSAFY